MDTAKLREFATRYTGAWCSQKAASVASFYAENGSLTINKGNPSIGRAAITAAAQEFMTTFPDLVVRMDDLTLEGDHVVFRWTARGTNTGPGGTGKAVRFSGYEEWTLGVDGLIAASKGHFDEAEYQRQFNVSTDTPRAGGAVVEDTGWGLVIYHHDADGKWRVARDAWGLDHPAPAK